MFTVLVSQAQQPLSKRDQKKKAEFEAMIEAEEKYELLRAKADRAFSSCRRGVVGGPALFARIHWPTPLD